MNDLRSTTPSSGSYEDKDLKDASSVERPSPPYEGGERGEVVKSQKTSSGNKKSEADEEFRLHYNNQLKTNSLIALATTGFTGIALEIVLLYAFQNIYGYIYERMGVIVAVFMVGLAFGGYITNRIIQKRNFKWVILLMVFEGIIGFYALILPFIIQGLSSYSIAAEIGLTCFIGIAGILTGLGFPLVNKLFMQSSDDIAVSAGATNSADHIGAFLGAILTGVIFLPLLGVFGTCLILATLNLSSLILIGISLCSGAAYRYSKNDNSNSQRK
ncbi:MAG: hypothetical protein A3G70_05525 [Planctomycetes bacterium RIFCSPLOWO2_12_FULL_39_13]|nr:MAG: hypothetical protein A3G70_05525 [Planctomycetes bacterium RIFCSPLOWO2_12_FULL_39_13]